MTGDWKERATSLLHAVSKEPVRSYSHTDFGRAQNAECISVIVDEPKTFFSEILNKILPFTAAMLSFPGAQKRALAMVERLRPQLPPGTVCFIGSTRWYGAAKPNGVELVIGPGDDQFDILRLAKTDATNYDMATEDLIATLKTYDAEYGIDIFRAETDTIEFRVKRVPRDLTAWTDQLYKFCPDIIDQGVETKEALAAEIRRTGRVALWWD